MKKLLTFMAVAAASSISNAGYAAAPTVPYASYYPLDGRIEIINPTSSPLANISVLSSDGTALKTDGAAFLELIPGAIRDNSEFPFAFSYLNLSVGKHNAGFVAKPFLSGYPFVGPAGNGFPLTFEYRLGSLLTPLIQGQFIAAPEPAALSMAGFGLFGLVRFARRRACCR